MSNGEGIPQKTILNVVVALVLIAIFAMLILALTQGNTDPALITSITGLVLAVVGPLILLVRVEQVHRIVNSAATKQRQEIARLKTELRKLKKGLPS